MEALGGLHSSAVAWAKQLFFSFGKVQGSWGSWSDQQALIFLSFSPARVSLSLSHSDSPDPLTHSRESSCLCLLFNSFWLALLLSLNPYGCKRVVVRKKTGLCGENFQVADPPLLPPQFGKPVIKKKVGFIIHFRTSGTFLVFTKKSQFWPQRKQLRWE